MTGQGMGHEHSRLHCVYRMGEAYSRCAIIIAGDVITHAPVMYDDA